MRRKKGKEERKKERGEKEKKNSPNLLIYSAAMSLPYAIELPPQGAIARTIIYIANLNFHDLTAAALAVQISGMDPG